MEEEYLFASGMHVLFFNVAVHVRYFEYVSFFKMLFKDAAVQILSCSQ